MEGINNKNDILLWYSSLIKIIIMLCQVIFELFPYFVFQSRRNNFSSNRIYYVMSINTISIHQSIFSLVMLTIFFYTEKLVAIID